MVKPSSIVFFWLIGFLHDVETTAGLTNFALDLWGEGFGCFFLAWNKTHHLSYWLRFVGRSFGFRLSSCWFLGIHLYLCLLLLLTFAPSCLSNPGEGAEEEFRNVSNKSEITFKSRASQVQLLHGHHHGNPFVLTAINRMLWFVSRSCHDSNVRPPSPHHAGNSKLQIARLRLSPRSAIAELELDLER